MRYKGANLSWGLAVTVACLFIFITSSPSVFAADNSWTNTGGGSWETPANWSLGVAPTNTDSMFLTNSGTYTVAIDDTTANTGDATTWLSVSNLTVGASSGAPTLLIDFTNASRALSISEHTVVGTNGLGSLIQNNGTVYTRTLTVGTTAGTMGTVNVNGGTLLVTNHLGGSANTLLLGVADGSTGILSIANASLIVTNGAVGSTVRSVIGSDGYGRVSISNGIFYNKTLFLGEITGSLGEMYIGPGGTNFMSGLGGANLQIGRGGSGLVVVDGGVFRAINSAAVTLSFGSSFDPTRHGTLILSNGIAEFAGLNLLIGGANGQGNGIWNLYGGTGTVSSTTFSLAEHITSKGSILVAGGYLDVQTGMSLGRLGQGTMTVSNGTWRGRSVTMGGGAGARAQLNIAGGDSAITNLVVGSVLNSTGTVLVTGGNLYVTNVAATATIDVGMVGRGSFTISNGTVVADRLFATNGASSVLTLAGGTLSVKSTTVSNGATFVAGNGLATTKLNLQGGTHSFADGLTLNTNATLSGDGFSLLTLGGSLSLATNSTFVVDLMTNTLAGLDRAFVTGAVSIAGSALTLRITNYTHTLGEQFTLIDNDGTSDSVVGFFSGLPNNAFLDASAGGQDAFFRILYDGGDGNDVVLLATIPEPGVLALFAAGGLVFTLRRRR